MAKNIVIFGETGCGKSSLVNLLRGEYVAKVSNGAKGCTLDFTAYPINQRYSVYDTAGLSEGTNGSVRAEAAMSKLKALIQKLSSEGGVHLLVFVIKMGKVTRTMEHNYNLFVKTICMQKVPVVLFVSGSDFDTSVSKEWWQKNQDHFAKCGMTFCGAVVGCTADIATFPYLVHTMLEERRQKSKQELVRLIESRAMEMGWKKENPESWFQAVLPNFLMLLGGAVALFWPPAMPAFSIGIISKFVGVRTVATAMHNMINHKVSR